jgi:hypothetical protein
MLAVRTTTATRLERIFWQRKMEGGYSNKQHNNSFAYSRMLVGKITFATNVGYMGKEVTVMVIHIHNLVGHNQKGFKLAHANIGEWLYDAIVKHNVDVMNGDFNMSMFKVIDSLRSRGLEIDLGAWYPWKAESGTTMSDSMGIFLIGYKATVKLCYGLECLHADDASGLGCNEKDQRTTKTFSIHPKKCGLGHTLATYMPKGDAYADKMRRTLTGTHSPSALMALPPMDRLKHAVAGTEEAYPDGGWNYLRFKEKKLEEKLWTLNGVIQGGTHFPLCLFTNNTSRRSPERYEARKNRRTNTQSRQWAPTQPRSEPAIVAIAVAVGASSGGSSGSGYWNTAQTNDRSGGWRQQGWWSTPEYTQDTGNERDWAQKW